MLSKAQVKDIRALTQYKSRKEQGVFLVAGDKLAREWLEAEAPVKIIIAEKDWLDAHHKLISLNPNAQTIEVNAAGLARISTLQTPNRVLLVAHLPKETPVSYINEWCIVLDHLQDPGNLGAIIRIADWYNIKHIIASPDSVDYYNPKVVQAAMGGHLRVNLHTAALPDFLMQTKLPIFAAALDGQNIYQVEKPNAGILVIGNESKGISTEILELATQKVHIPRKGGAESLNAAVATGIICALLLPQ